MADSPSLKFRARISLRSLLALVALVAVGCVALKYANAWWVGVVATITLLAFMAAVVVAFVDRGPRQAFAIGFAACAAIYGGMVASSRWFYAGGAGAVAPLVNREMDPDAGILPTTRLLGAYYKAVVELWNVDQQTGKRIQKIPTEQVAATYAAGFGPKTVEQPSREAFMPVGHCLWMLLLGYIGGGFARSVFARRLRDQNDQESLTSSVG